MKIYIDFSKQAITKIDSDVAYVGDVYSNVFELLFFNYGNNADWFPTMSQLAPNGREAGDFSADALGENETYDYVENDITYKRYTFTIGDGWVRMKGRSNFFIWVNNLVDSNALQRKCYGKVSVVLNESTDNYFIQDAYFNPKIKEYIDGKLADLNGLEPSGVATSTQILAFTEDKGVWVGTDTGKWYYWNGTQYAEGGTFIATELLLATVDLADGVLVKTGNNWVVNDADLAEQIKAMCYRFRFTKDAFDDNGQTTFDGTLIVEPIYTATVLGNTAYIYSCTGTLNDDHIIFTMTFLEISGTLVLFSFSNNYIYNQFGVDGSGYFGLKNGTNNVVLSNGCLKIPTLNGIDLFADTGACDISFTKDSDGNLTGVSLTYPENNPDTYHVLNPADLEGYATENYVDNAIKNSIQDLRWELGSHTLDVESDNDTAYEKQVPNDTVGCQINSVGGMSYKSENLIVLNDVAETTTNGITYKVENGVITLNGTATAGVYPNFPLETSLILNGTYSFKPVSDGTISEVSSLFLLENTSTGDFLTTTSSVATGVSLSKTYAYFRINISSGTSFTNFTIKPMLISGSTVPTTFKVGFTGIRHSAVTSVVSKDSNNTTLETLTIANQIKTLTGYGWGINDNCYNYIDFDRKVFVQKVARVDLGVFGWSYTSADNLSRFYVGILDAKRPINNTTLGNILLANYENNTWNNFINDTLSKDMSVSLRSDGALGVRDLRYTDVISFKTAMSGVYLYYELATPVETDISAYLTTDEIQVEALGSLEFTNTYSQDVPSDIDYLTEVAD